MTDDFVMRVLTLFAMFPDDLGTDDLMWRVDGEYAPITFLVNCSDTFAWATADCERLTPDNIDVLEAALTDLKDAALPTFYAGTLFAARVRGMRPMRLAYPIRKSINGIDGAGLAALYDACGPERDPRTFG